MENQKIFNIANPAQRNAIKHPPAPLMIIAGAGTGKTFTLENRVVYLITEYNINPENILTITYTEKAAQELKTRVIKQVGQEALSMFVGTFHSFCFQIMKHYKNDSPSTLIDQSEAIHMLLDRYDEFHPLESDEFAINPKTAVTESFIPFFNRVRDELININRGGLPGSGLDIASIINGNYAPFLHAVAANLFQSNPLWLVPGATLITSIIFLGTTYWFTLRIVSNAKLSKESKVAIAILTTILTVLSFGVSTFSYVRYYAYFHSILNFPLIYFLILMFIGGCAGSTTVSYTHLTLPTNREV